MLTIEEKATNFDTMRHIERVRNLLNECVLEILKRGQTHDQSKLESPEVELFTEYTDKLSKVTYGSDEYEDFRKKLKPALDHHYAKNSHHPENVFYNEIWKDVIGYEGVYQVSDLGRVKSLEKTITRSGYVDFLKQENIRKSHITPKGYARLMLQNKDKRENKFVHVLVAESFLIKNNKNQTQVNHKNGNKLDNSVSNLEWTTPSENLQHAYDNSLRESNVKYVVKCNELDIVTFGCCKMEQELRSRGYEKASANCIFNCIEGNSNTHLDLTFESWNINEYKELNSPINDMTLIDLIEMLCDWKAASERHNDGNIRKSIDINGKRFNMSSQLIKIFENTAKVLFDY